jgi:hypothetical protein
MRSRHPAAIAEVYVRVILANVCTLGPGGVGDDGKARAWIESALRNVPGSRKDFEHAFRSTLGAILYRSGRYREAIDRIDEGMAFENGAPGYTDGFFLAMAQARSGDHARARAIMAQFGPEEPSGPPAAYWDVHEVMLLRQETFRLILDPPFPSNPFAH